MEIQFNYGNVNLSFCLVEGKVLKKLSADEEYIRKCEGIENFSGLCEVQIRGRKSSYHTGLRRLAQSECNRFFYESHEVFEDEKGKGIKITQKSDIARLDSYFYVFCDTEVVRVWNEITNIGGEAFTLEHISSYNEILMSGAETFDETYLWTAPNGSYCECQWSVLPLSAHGIFGGKNRNSFKKIAFGNTGTWSTKNYLPLGMLETKDKKCTMWQIEANGSWNYEIGDLWDSAALSLSGPSFDEHQWQKTLQPGESFQTVKAAIAKGGSFEDCVGKMTRYRRKIVDANRLKDSVIFNEYMYASWNSPSVSTAKTLYPMAKEFGAGYYIIDCGWHDEEPDPFYHVGKWRESKTRYPDGLKKLADEIGKSMCFGLWLEPEVVGALGDSSETYKAEDYFSRQGKRLWLSDRYQLDFRSGEVRSRLENVVADMVEKYGINYLKLDYNIEAGAGTDFRAESCGDGLLEHNRGYIGWLKKIRERFPDLVIENCASGGNRMDYLTLSLCDVQSTSDQTDYKIYPYIAANMFSALLPEQCAVWAYPAAHADEEQPDAETTVMNMVNGLGGRMRLASKLNLLSEENAALVKEGVEVSKKIDAFRKRALPFFKDGRPAKMGDGQLAYGLKDVDRYIFFVYRMQGGEQIEISLGSPIREAIQLYPSGMSVPFRIDGEKFIVTMKQKYSARVFEIKA